MSEIGRGNHHRIKICADQLTFVFNQLRIRRYLLCTSYVVWVARTNRHSYSIPRAVLMKQSQVA